MHRALALSRVAACVLIISALVATLTDTSGLVPSSFTEIATYFTFQANVVAVLVWGATLFHSWTSRPSPRWLEYGRAFTAANLVTVAVIYWVAIQPLGLQDGGQLIYVMIVSHIVTPVYAATEQVLVGPRLALPWRNIWMIAGYACLWVTVAVTRAWLGGPVIYDYLAPSEGAMAVASALTWNMAVLLVASAAAMRIRRWRRWRRWLGNLADATEPSRHSAINELDNHVESNAIDAGQLTASASMMTPSRSS